MIHIICHNLMTIDIVELSLLHVPINFFFTTYHLVAVFMYCCLTCLSVIEIRVKCFWCLNTDTKHPLGAMAKVVENFVCIRRGHEVSSYVVNSIKYQPPRTLISGMLPLHM